LKSQAIRFLLQILIFFLITNAAFCRSAQEIETKQRKSVAFSEGSVIMDTNGQVTDAPPAEKPTGGMQYLSNPSLNTPVAFASAPLTIS
jgi:hypothetical protein